MCAVWAALFLPVGLAQQSEPMTLQAVAQLAVGRSPEVLARYHNFRAATGELTSVGAPLLPQVDVIASAGQRQRNDPSFRGNFNESTLTFQVTQLLWDGLATRHQRQQFTHARLVRLFEFFDASEQTALEAVRAYYDVLRYRNLVMLAEENVVQHRAVWEQLEQRVTAGVGRRVDLQQATGRMALSESNLRVEIANLHDVSARFQRIVGLAPSQRMAEPDPLISRIPATTREVLQEAAVLNPQVRATVENVRAATFARDARRGARWSPRVQLQLKEDRGRDINGTPGLTNNSSAMVLFNWNLFSGYADTGRVEQAEGLLAQARDQRDKACRDTRQTLAIAMNDLRKLDEQATFLRQHRQSVERARDAYRQQFDIGQRSLLDLLDTENEVFQARRAEANADYDLKISYGRVHAGIGRLLAALELAPHDEGAQKEVEQWAMDSDRPEFCAPEPVPLFVAERTTLEERAEQLLRSRARTSIEFAALKPPGGAVKPPSPPVRVAVPAGPEQEVAAALRAWVAAWAGKDLGAYLGSYMPDFAAPEGTRRTDWEIARARALKRAGTIKLFVSNEQFTVDGPEQVTVRFHQSYASATYRDEVEKTLVWKKAGDRWLIARETSRPAPPESFGVDAKLPPDAAPRPTAPAVDPAPTSRPEPLSLKPEPSLTKPRPEAAQKPRP